MSWAKEVLDSGRWRVVNRRTGEFRLLSQYRRGPRSGPYQVGGIRADRRMGIAFTPEMDPEVLRMLRRLPAQIQARFQRRAMRQALNVWKRIAQPLYQRHRTKIQRKHLDQSLAIVSRVYRRRSGAVIWGALGFRMGRLTPGIGGVLPQANRLYAHEWAGWRAHFFESGFTATGGMLQRKGFQVTRKGLDTLYQRKRIKARVARGEGRFIPGKRYLPKVLDVGRFAARAVFRHSLVELIRKNGGRQGRIPKSLYAAEMRTLLL